MILPVSLVNVSPPVLLNKYPTLQVARVYSKSEF